MSMEMSRIQVRVPETYMTQNPDKASAAAVPMSFSNKMSMSGMPNRMAPGQKNPFQKVPAISRWVVYQCAKVSISVILASSLGWKVSPRLIQRDSPLMVLPIPGKKQHASNTRQTHQITYTTWRQMW